MQEALGRLPYLVALDAEEKAIVLAVRGTSSVSDALTDAIAQPCDLLAGWLGRAAQVGPHATQRVTWYMPEGDLIWLLSAHINPFFRPCSALGMLQPSQVLFMISLSACVRQDISLFAIILRSANPSKLLRHAHHDLLTVPAGMPQGDLAGLGPQAAHAGVLAAAVAIASDLSRHRILELLLCGPDACRAARPGAGPDLHSSASGSCGGRSVASLRDDKEGARGCEGPANRSASASGERLTETERRQRSVAEIRRRRLDCRVRLVGGPGFSCCKELPVGCAPGCEPRQLVPL